MTESCLVIKSRQVVPTLKRRGLLSDCYSSTGGCDQWKESHVAAWSNNVICAKINCPSVYHGNPLTFVIDIVWGHQRLEPRTGGIPVIRFHGIQRWGAPWLVQFESSLCQFNWIAPIWFGRERREIALSRHSLNDQNKPVEWMRRNGGIFSCPSMEPDGWGK